MPIRCHYRNNPVCPVVVFILKLSYLGRHRVKRNYFCGAKCGVAFVLKPDGIERHFARFVSVLFGGAVALIPPRQNPAPDPGAYGPVAPPGNWRGCESTYGHAGKAAIKKAGLALYGRWGLLLVCYIYFILPAAPITGWPLCCLLIRLITWAWWLDFIAAFYNWWHAIVCGAE